MQANFIHEKELYTHAIYRMKQESCDLCVARENIFTHNRTCNTLPKAYPKNVEQRIIPGIWSAWETMKTRANELLFN